MIPVGIALAAGLIVGTAYLGQKAVHGIERGAKKIACVATLGHKCPPKH